ncbi:MAG: class I SAM-dependent methyltransferase [Lachnospiraceae bacterium]|nr:class I SAM-dependent methyltransferase [Candidatus Fimimorpha excrementavium]
MRRFQISEWCRRFAEEVVRPGDLCMDATAGTGQDTVFLARLVGERGMVLAYDIQEEALKQTRERLKREGLETRVRLIRKSHAAMEEDAGEGEASCIMFNFGYLPGGDHTISTKPETSVMAVDAGLRILKPGGLMCLCIYSGKDTGYEEKRALLTHLKTLDQRQYLVIVSEYYNRKNDPPIPVLIYKK